MSSAREKRGCPDSELLHAHALRALSPDDARTLEEHLAGCPACRRERDQWRGVVDSFVAWPTDVLRPSVSLWDRIAARIEPTSERSATAEASPLAAAGVGPEPEWEDVAPGIEVKLLATDAEQGTVSMLVRLAPGAAYPPHTHEGVEELHLLDGELWINENKLLPGDFNRGEPGTADTRVWSETGCTCVLITSARDRLR